MQPIRRNFKFNFNKERVHNWHQAGVGVTAFFNALSVFFPDGERYFIRSVRAFSDKTPEIFREQVSAFIGQEAFHGREHEVLNELLESDKFLALLQKGLRLLSEKLPRDVNLATTVALEHITAILAQGLLEDIKYTVDSDEGFRNLWIWHSLEETEHKAVAFDLYEDVVGFGVYSYVLRCVALVLATIVFAVAVSERYFSLLHKQKQLTAKNVFATIEWLFWNPATMSKIVPLWFTWFKFGFHPWDHDNAHELSKYKEFLNDGLWRNGSVSGS